MLLCVLLAAESEYIRLVPTHGQFPVIPLPLWRFRRQMQHLLPPVTVWYLETLLDLQVLQTLLSGILPLVSRITPLEKTMSTDRFTWAEEPLRLANGFFPKGLLSLATFK